MSHKTLISGTAYEVVGGAQMIDGTKFQMGGVKPFWAGRNSISRLPKDRTRLICRGSTKLVNTTALKTFKCLRSLTRARRGAYHLVRKRNTCI